MPINFSNEQDLLPINPGERHVAAVVLVDTSGSMSGAPIDELNKGLVEFGQALQNDPLALGRADVSIISFNSSVQTEIPFQPAANYSAPTLSAGGLTSYNEAVITALDALEQRKAEYKATGISYYRPWLFVLTDGYPTDNNRESDAKNRLHAAIRQNKVVFMPMGIGADVDLKKLQEYYPDETANKLVLHASADQFKEAFVWLSNSLSVVSSSDPVAQSNVNLPPLPSLITVGIN